MDTTNKVKVSLFDSAVRYHMSAFKYAWDSEMHNYLINQRDTCILLCGCTDEEFWAAAEQEESKRAEAENSLFNEFLGVDTLASIGVFM